MYKVIDAHNNHLPVKSGFKTAAAANNIPKVSIIFFIIISFVVRLLKYKKY